LLPVSVKVAESSVNATGPVIAPEYVVESLPVSVSVPAVAELLVRVPDVPLNALMVGL
jgi:hypothetical protein